LIGRRGFCGDVLLGNGVEAWEVGNFVGGVSGLPEGQDIEFREYWVEEQD
jgi:hypothetical protein